MKDIVAKVFNPSFRAVITSGLRCSLEAKRRFSITDLSLMKETHLIISAAMLLNGLYDGESKLRLTSEHVKNVHGIDYYYRLYSEILGGKALRAYGTKEEMLDGDEAPAGFFHVKRQLKGATTWQTSTLKLKNEARGFLSDDLQSYLEYSDQIKSYVYINSSFSNLPQDKSTGLALVIQKLPGTEDAELKEAFDTALSSPHLKALEDDFSFEGVRELFPNTESELSSISYQCTCSKQTVIEHLVSGGKEALQEMQNQGQSVTCMMCNEVYTFADKELGALLKKVQ